MPSAQLLLSQAFNGLALGTLLALVSSGLTIILGTLGVLNFAHGALFMLGAYTIFVIAGATGSFVAGLAAGTLLMLVIGVLLERVLIRWFYNRPPEDQILVTFGAAIVIVEAVRAIFGGENKHVDTPAWGAASPNSAFSSTQLTAYSLLASSLSCSLSSTWCCIKPRSASWCEPGLRTRA